MNRARNWSEFNAALKDFGAPQMNIVYADTGGTIAFIAPARVPIRESGNGWLPAPVWTGAYDWTGYIPFDALPHAVDPSDGRFVSANNKIVPDSYPYFLSRDWALPDRADRITGLPKDKPKQSLDSTAAIAADALSKSAPKLLPLLLRVAPTDDRSKAALTILRQWDARMDRKAAAPLIFVARLRELDRELFASALGQEFQVYWKLHPLIVRDVLSGETPWCDGPSAPPAPSCMTVLSQSLDKALNQLDHQYGTDIAQWRWGEAHRATFRNPVLSKIPILGGLLAQQISADGGSFTVNAGDMDIANKKHPYRDTLGPGFRMILDFSNVAASRFLIAPGLSGSPFSAHYGDLLRSWRDFDWLVIGQEQGGETLTLAPK